MKTKNQNLKIKKNPKLKNRADKKARAGFVQIFENCEEFKLRFVTKYGRVIPMTIVV